MLHLFFFDHYSVANLIFDILAFMGVDYARRVLCTSSRHARVKFSFGKYSNDSNISGATCELRKICSQPIKLPNDEYNWVLVYTGQMSWLSQKSRWNLKPHDDKYIPVLIIVNIIEVFCNTSTVAINHHNLCYTLCWKKLSHIFWLQCATCFS